MNTSVRPRSLLRGALSLALLLSALAVVEGAVAPAATALVPPVLNTVPEQVSADPLPTVQINGVVWDQEIVGNTVYVVGQFTQARPAGAAAGVNQTPRANVLAYDLTTGVLLPNFVANTNAQVKTVTAAPDGSRIYIGGQFTTVNTTTRNRIAALNPTTGAVITDFNAITNSTVNDLVATADTVYAGGIFTGAGSGAATPRAKLAAFTTATGALTTWAPQASANVQTILMSPDRTRLFVGGIFLQINSQYAYGMGAVSPVDGTSIPWAANTVIKNGGDYNGAILHLFTDGTSIYGNGFTYGRDWGNLEGVFKADATTGAITWVEDCHGDTYQGTTLNGYVYTASHAHFCGNVGGFPQSDSRNLQWAEYQRHAVSFKDAAAGTIRRDNWSYHNLEGLPAPSPTTWAPQWTVGTFTGQGQATWAVEAKGQYVAYGGEFTRVNTTNQQGLVRFAVRSIAPNVSGPRLTGDSFPIKVASESTGTVRVSFPANFDRDDGVLSYDIQRNNVTVATLSKQATYWNQPAVSYLDTGPGLTPGQTYNYRVRARDPWGNAQLSNQYAVTVAGSGAPTIYADRVLQDGPALYWRLGESPGATQAQDEAGVQTGAVTAMTFGRSGAILGDPDTAVSPNDSSSRILQPDLISQQGLPENHATRDDLTVEAWFRTTSSQGGRLLGFGNSKTGTSSTSTADRALYVSNDGRVYFGVRTAPEHTGYTSARVRRSVQSQSGLNDGAWHHAVGILASDGMRLYVDGAQVGSRTDTNSGNEYYGFWRVGADTLSGFPGQPSSTRLNGDIDEAAVYYRPLTPAEITNHWNLSGRGSGNVTPTAGFSFTTAGLTASFDADGSSDLDGTIVSYAWDFGDGETDTVSGIAPDHPYDVAGTYDVTLTVTDNEGGTGSIQLPVTVTAANAPPFASFTATPGDLTVDVDASTSSDDGSIVLYQWDFDDGDTSTTGVHPPPHPYLFAGTYDITLTVTDDDGAQSSTTQQVVITEPGAPAVFAADAFERTVANGLGTANLGGTWTNTGVAANFSVSGGAARHRMPTAGTELKSYLNSVSAGDVLATIDLSLDKAPAGGGVYASLAVRRIGTSDYRVRVRTLPTSTTLTLFRVVNNTLTSLGTVTVPGLVYAPGDTLRVQLRAVGSGTTTLQGKVWRVGTPEPPLWQLTANDSTAALQNPGGVGFETYLSAAAGGNPPVVASWDDLSLTEP